MAAILRGPRAGAVLLVLLLAVSIGVPAVAAIVADGGQPAGDGPSVGVLSTAAIGGLHRLLLGDAASRSVHLDALAPAALVIDVEADLTTGNAGNAFSAVDFAACAMSLHGPRAPLRI